MTIYIYIYIHVNKHLKSDWKDLYLPRSSTCLPRTSQAQASSFAKAIPRVIPQMLRVHTAQIPQSLWPTLVATVAASRCVEHPELWVTQSKHKATWPSKRSKMVKGNPRLKWTTPQRTSRITPSNGSTALCLCAKNRFNKFQHQDWKGSHIYKPCIVRSFQHVSNMFSTCFQHVFLVAFSLHLAQLLLRSKLSNSRTRLSLVP